jgi:hypothetical protein
MYLGKFSKYNEIGFSSLYEVALAMGPGLSHELIS